MKIDRKNIIFNNRVSIEQIEEGTELCPKFNQEGLIPCITIEYETKEVLMLSFLNEEALKKSIETDKAHYYSRSRKNIWLKGEVSGMYHQIQDILIDDDQDSIIFTVKLNENQEYFGVKKGSTSRFELGSSIRSYYKFEFLENVFITNRLSLYSDYLENPENIDLDYTINTSLKVNKYLTTDLILQFIYDNNAVKRLQVRQVMGIGLSLNF